MTETSLSLLGRLAARRDEADWQRFDAMYRPLLRAWAARLGLGDADAEDVAQDALMAVLREVGGFDRRGPGAFRGWLWRLLANRVRDCRRRRARAGDPAPDMGDIADPNGHAGRTWDMDHDRHVLGVLMRRVRPDFAPATWQAFRRQVIDGVPAGQAAVELDISLNAALIAKSRVLRRLREESRDFVAAADRPVLTPG